MFIWPGDFCLLADGRCLLTRHASRPTACLGTFEYVGLRAVSAEVPWQVIKTSRCITVEEGWPDYGIGAEIAASIFECAHPTALGCRSRHCLKYL